MKKFMAKLEKAEEKEPAFLIETESFCSDLLSKIVVEKSKLEQPSYSMQLSKMLNIVG